MAGDSADIVARRLASCNMLPRRHFDMPVRGDRASHTAKKSFEVIGRDFRYSCRGVGCFRLARLIVAIVAVLFLAIVLESSSSPRIGGRPRDRLLGVFSKG